MSNMNELERKIDVLIARFESLQKQVERNGRRHDETEERLGPVYRFVDRCDVGRKAILWVLGGIGTIVFIAMGLWDRLK